ncbi:MAG: RluA family pseudouridine synthase [Burkholderiaceae bacterium]|jgi:23S rRNA pseudouridine955/2504/2580 synthase
MNDLGERAPAKVEASRVRFFRVGIEEAGQRIDNFLLRLAKGVPKSHVYRVIRGGEVRVNKKRVEAAYRLVQGDEIRLPPMRTSLEVPKVVRAAEFAILLEDEHLLVLDKPAGVAVHGGSGVSFGVIEQLRAARPKAPFLELAHRLDRETSGILVLAKKRTALLAVHEQIRQGAMDKHYLALVWGAWPNARQHVKAPLMKYLLADGERRVRVDPEGVPAHTIVMLREQLDGAALLDVELKTGRTHQIRVHLSHLGFPIAGDEKYGNYGLNRQHARGTGKPTLKRMFLHAWRIGLRHPATGAPLELEAPLPQECEQYLEALRHAHAI